MLRKQSATGIGRYEFCWGLMEDYEDYDRRCRIIANPPKPTARSETAEGSGTAATRKPRLSLPSVMRPPCADEIPMLILLTELQLKVELIEPRLRLIRPLLLLPRLKDQKALDPLLLVNWKEKSRDGIVS